MIAVYECKSCLGHKEFPCTLKFTVCGNSVDKDLINCPFNGGPHHGKPKWKYVKTLEDEKSIIAKHCEACRSDWEGNEPFNCKIYEETNECKFIKNGVRTFKHGQCDSCINDIEDKRWFNNVENLQEQCGSCPKKPSVFVPYEHTKNTGKKYAGTAVYTTNVDEEIEMSGFRPVSEELPDDLKKTFDHLENASKKYSFLKYEEDPDLLAICVSHKHIPGSTFAIFKKKIVVHSENMVEEQNRFVEGYAVEYWDDEQSDRDRRLHKTDSLIQAVRCAVMEIVLLDFEKTEF